MEGGSNDAVDDGEKRRAQFHQKITGKDEVRQHLAELGFVVGECITVINETGGNMILSVKGTRIALDRGMANRILV